MKTYTPSKEGFVRNQNHRIYYGVYGNPRGRTWIFCHGGPGYHTVPSSNLKFFDLKKDQVILFDQRGSGKSTPHGELKNNNTMALVSDMELILKTLKIDKVSVFGGSWGSTLALIFAIKNPSMVKSLVIRGIFLARKKDIEDIYEPKKDWTTDQHEKWKATLLVLKKKFNLNHVFDGLKILKKKDKDSFYFAKLWAAYEDLICSKGFRILDFDKEYLKMALAISLIEIHYFANDCFITEDYILKNIDTIKGIPCYIVQGGEDMVCPKNQALDLCNKMNNCELYIDSKGGHSNSEKMTAALKKMVAAARLI